ncbi:UNVERIFIED_CONTAM: hypothetical protein PYX00_004841 [Menopon gallinae]|uniref:FAM192A/Fyv6 N-terminal domain-containing protein n=1 Tax=Menopon gallinae TaxID=328185 RepID=A0AAW2I7I9_9NEOP
MSSGFVSENELAERRRIRQEEWEKVRQPNQPLEAPEEPYDHRSLYERLEEQKLKKQQEYEEAHKLKNMVKGLDDDEIEFLDLVDQKKLEVEQLKEMEEKQELLDFRKKVEKLKEQAFDQRIHSEIHSVKQNNNSSSVKSQHKLLKGVVVKRKAKEAIKKDNNPDSSSNSKEKDDKEPEQKRRKSDEVLDKKIEGSAITGILPGLGSYVDSSDESDECGS